MSRIGKKPVAVPEGVTLDVAGQDVKAKGSKGELNIRIHDDVSVKLVDGEVVLEPRSNALFAQKIWPTMRTLVHNIVVGVTDGFSKKLEIHGVGLRGNMQGNTVSGIDKQKVGQVAANIRSFKKPEPYKGKGIRYADEYILRKEGKKK